MKAKYKRVYGIAIFLLFLIMSCGDTIVNYPDSQEGGNTEEIEVSNQEDPNGVTRYHPDLRYDVRRTGTTIRPPRACPDTAPIFSNNCGGEINSVQQLVIYRTFTTTCNVVVTNVVSNTFLGNALVAAVSITKSISEALGITIGVSTEVESSLTITTPPGKKTITTIEWKERLIKGEVEITQPDGTFVDICPFTIRDLLILEQKGIETISCDSNTDLISDPNNISILEEPLTILDLSNGHNYSFSLPPNLEIPPRENYCALCGEAYIETENEEREYELFVPYGWAVIIVAQQSVWSTDKYLDNGILVICGEWEGLVHISTGNLCGVPLQWKEEALLDRRATSGNSDHPEYIIYPSVPQRP